MNVKSWRAFHTGDRITTGKSLAAFKRLPKHGFLSLVLYHDQSRPDGKPYRTIVDGADHYVAFQAADGPEFYCTNDSLESIEEAHPGAIVKLGEEIDFDEFKAVDAQAVAAVDP